MTRKFASFSTGFAVLAIFVSIATTSVHAAEPIPTAPAIESETDALTEFSSHVKIRPELTYAFVSPSALNTYLASQASATSAGTGYQIGGTPGFAAAADYEITPQFLVGMRLDWFNASTSSATVTGANVGANQQDFVSGLPLYATATLKQPFADHWSFGLTAGGGVPFYYHYGREISGSTNPAFTNGTTTYGAHPFSALGLAFVSYEVQDRISLRFEAGYRALASDQMRLTSASATQAAGAFATGSNGGNLNIDASAFILGAGAAISL